MNTKKRCALNFICKNEGHVIQRMLNSALPITDLIVAVDTGSTDNTIDLIKQFGQLHNLPTYVFERPFDNFCNSRNFALSKLQEIASNLKWDKALTWGFWFDCDEEIIFEQDFTKTQIKEDLYTIHLLMSTHRFTRHFLFRLSKNFYWEGPIHEQLTTNEGKIQQEILDSIHIYHHASGHSWTKNIQEKYTQYANKLIEFIEHGNRQFRWLYFTGQCFFLAASYAKSKAQKRELFTKALYYYTEAMPLSHDREENYLSLYRVSETKINLQESPDVVKKHLLKAYLHDPRHPDALALIIKYYNSIRRKKLAYIYSRFAVTHYHGQMITDKDISERNDKLTQWKLLYYHILACKPNHKQEAKKHLSELKSIVKFHPEYFTPKEKAEIRFL